jgi:hypothetical protein
MRSGMGQFFLLILLLILLQFGVSQITVQDGQPPLFWTYLITPFFIALPVFAIFRASDHQWDWKLALQFIVLGLIIHIPLSLADRALAVSPGQSSLLGSALAVVGQGGLLMWTVGLGALLSTRISDQNMLIPISLFLVGYDMFLVLTPIGFTQKIMKANPDLLPTVAYKLPSVGSVKPFAFVGPADFLFMGMFFVALYRFKMNARQTMAWMIVAILVYLLLSMFTHALPLMVPIGITVLAVNWAYFKLKRDEWIGTGVVAALVIGIIAFGATRKPAPQSGISSEATDSAPLGSEATPVPTTGDQPRSNNPNAPTSTPDPQ